MPNVVVTRRTPAIAVVAINRPGRRNACDIATWRELARSFAALGEDRDVRLVVLTGTGGNFCAGADIAEFATVRADSAGGATYEREVDACYAAIAGVAQPTIAAIEGYCVGGGCALAMCCDFRVAHKAARFGIPAARLGVMYGIQECKMLLALVGLANAKRILYRGDLVDAGTAARMGLVDETTEGDAVDCAAAFAGSMSENAPLSIAGAKLTLQSLAYGEIERNMPRIDALMRRTLDSADYKEGAKAFGEKRRPVFTGR